MSCWFLERNKYVNCAIDVYNLLDSKELARQVASLYKFNEKAYNIRYNESYYTKMIEDNEIFVKKQIEQTPDNFYKILSFFNCVQYQCDEEEKIYKDVETITNKVIYELARNIFNNETAKFEWGEY